MTCRICQNNEFTPILDLGMTPLADDFLTEARLSEPETRYPLKLQICTHCQLVQLTYVVRREMLYGEEYPYVSSTTKTGAAHYLEMAKTITARLPKKEGLAIDIGSNVGVLLDGFKQCGMSVLGIEPVPKIAEMANARGIETINRFFDAALAQEIVDNRGKATVVTGTNVVAHIDNLHDLVRGLQILLAPGGLFVFEAPYLGELIRRREYDTIYHEHLSYFALSPIATLFERFGMQVVDIQGRSIHGGTARYFIAMRGDYPVNEEHIAATLHAEETLTSAATLESFANDVRYQRSDLNMMLRDMKRRGRRVVGVGAPAKGMTLLNYCKIDSELLDFVTEKAPLKIGRYTPGTHLPVMSDAALLTVQPDYALLLPWNFADEIMANLSEYTKRGGKFILPIPAPKVLERAA